MKTGNRCWRGLAAAALTIPSLLAQTSVMEGDQRRLEPPHRFQVFSKDEWRRSSFAKPGDLTWFRQARFGLFIHWGPVSLTGKSLGWGRHTHKSPDGGEGPIPDEEYDNLYKRFDPVKFDAVRWVQMAREAGMKYIVFVAKHHDGFCMWDSRYTGYKITNSPIKRDLLRELADACHKAGMPLGIYYSQRDWYHPDYFTPNHARYIRYMHDQVRELLTNYGKISILWFDAAWWGGMFKAEYWDSEQMYRMARALQPGILINNRSSIPGDFDTPEQHIGTFQNNRPWESCVTIGTQWSWKPNDRVKSWAQCWRLLTGCATGDGNLLLNLGPRADGTFEPEQEQRILQMGARLQKVGFTIYGTRGGPFCPGEWGGTTYRGKSVYVHLARGSGKWKLPPLRQRIVASKCLTGCSVQVTQSKDSTDIVIPPATQDEVSTIIELTLDAPVTGMAETCTQ